MFALPFLRLIACDSSAVTEHGDPLAAVCEAGANGDQASSEQCLDGWHARIPALQAKLEIIRQAMWKALPNEDADGQPFSGSYWCETDYDDLDFTKSHWGSAVSAQPARRATTRDDSKGAFLN